MSLISAIKKAARTMKREAGEWLINFLHLFQSLFSSFSLSPSIRMTLLAVLRARAQPKHASSIFAVLYGDNHTISRLTIGLKRVIHTPLRARGHLPICSDLVRKFPRRRLMSDEPRSKPWNWAQTIVASMNVTSGRRLKMTCRW